MLALFGVRRQAKLDKDDFKVYAADLDKYDLGDIDRGLVAICRTPRGYGETAFPDVATIEASIKANRKKKLDSDGSNLSFYECTHCNARQAGPRLARCHKCGAPEEMMTLLSGPASAENPADYIRVNLADLIREVMDKRKREGKCVWNLQDFRMSDAASPE